MALLGTPLLIVLGVVAVVVPVGAALLWSRVRGPRVVRAGSRVAMLVACQLAAVLLVGTALNDYGYFYGSWGEVYRSVRQSFGERYAVTPVHRDRALGQDHGGSGADGGLDVVGQRKPASTPTSWDRVGRLEQVRLTGPATGLSTDADVYLPPQYFQSGDAHRRFPAVEVLSGYPSTARMLTRRLGFQRKLLLAIDQHKAQPMVLVMMRPTLTYPRDTECTNVPGGPQVESFYDQDVPAEVASHYRVDAARWGVEGISTGGYCATKLAFDDPDRFPAAVSLSGYYRALEDRTTGDLWGGSQVVRNLNDLEWRLTHQPAPPVHLLLTSSVDERGPYGYGDLRRFLRLVRPPTKVATIVAAHGGHTFTTWKPEIPETLRWLSHQLAHQLTHQSPATGSASGRPTASPRA